MIACVRSSHTCLYIQCLVYNELPFTEEMRQSTFSSLPVEESSDANRKFEPSEEQLHAINQLITDMDLFKADKCEILTSGVYVAVLVTCCVLRVAGTRMARVEKLPNRS